MLELNKIYNMDCIDGLKLIDDNSIDLIVTSPPYNLLRFSRNGGKNVYDNYLHNNDNELEYRNWLSLVIKSCIPKIKNTGYFAFNIKYRYINNECILPYWVLESFKSLNLRNEIIWKYPGYVDVNQYKFYPSHEIIFLFSKSKNNFIFNSELCKLGDVWNIDNQGKNRISSQEHPAQFPIEIPLNFIKACINKNDLVLDPFMGSGTTALACLKLNRKFIGFEIDEKYCEIANKRLQDYKTQVRFI